MAKKKSFAKAFVGVTALAVTGKVVYDKYKILKEKFEKEEKESICAEVKKYNAVCTSKSIEIQDEDFEGCEIKAIASKLILDLSLAAFEKDAYINFKSDASIVKIILPEGVNVTCDIENIVSSIKNLVVNVEEEDIPSVFIIGKSTISAIEIIPANFYSDDDDDFEDEDDFESEDTAVDEEALNANEEVLKADKEVLKSDKEVLKSDKDITKTDKEVLKTDKEVLKTDKEVLKTDKEV